MFRRSMRASRAMPARPRRHGGGLQNLTRPLQWHLRISSPRRIFLTSSARWPRSGTRCIRKFRGLSRAAQSLTDWQAMVKSHPWLSLSAAALLGYFIVPRRRSETPTIVTVAAPSAHPAAVAPSATTAKKSRWPLVGTVLGMIAPIAVRAAQITRWATSRPGWRRIPCPGDQAPGAPRDRVRPQEQTANQSGPAGSGRETGSANMAKPSQMSDQGQAVTSRVSI